MVSLREVRGLVARVRKLCNDLDFLKRRESTSCDLKVITRKVVWSLRALSPIWLQECTGIL